MTLLGHTTGGLHGTCAGPKRTREQLDQGQSKPEKCRTSNMRAIKTYCVTIKNQFRRSDTAPHAKDSPGCGFLQLPAETRNQIYSYMLSPTVLMNDPRKHWNNHSLSKVHPKIRREYRDYYYSNNAFMLDLRPPTYDSDMLVTYRAIFQAWLRRLGTRDVGFLTHLKFYGDHFIADLRIVKGSRGMKLSVENKTTQRLRSGGEDDRQAAVVAAGAELKKIEGRIGGQRLERCDVERIVEVMMKLRQGYWRWTQRAF